MKRGVIIAVVIGTSLLGWMWRPAPAACAYCSTLPCTSHSQCGHDCVCIKSGMDLWGSCASINVEGQ